MKEGGMVEPKAHVQGNRLRRKGDDLGKTFEEVTDRYIEDLANEASQRNLRFIASCRIDQHCIGTGTPDDGGNLPDKVSQAFSAKTRCRLICQPFNDRVLYFLEMMRISSKAEILLEQLAKKSAVIRVRNKKMHGKKLVEQSFAANTRNGVDFSPEHPFIGGHIG